VPRLDLNINNAVNIHSLQALRGNTGVSGGVDRPGRHSGGLVVNRLG
jgi:hypothetical protein